MTRTAQAARGEVDSREQRKQDRADRTRTAILDAAVEVIARAGFAATTMEQVAQRAGYSVGSLYNYFESKEALIDALGVRLLGEALEALRRPLPSSLTARQKTELLVMRMLESVERSRGWILRMVQDGLATPPREGESSNAELLDVAAAIDEILATHVREVIAEGQARAVDPRVGATFIGSTARGFVLDWLRQGGEGSATELAPLIVELVFEGIGAHETPTPTG